MRLERKLKDMAILPEDERDHMLHPAEGCSDCFEPVDDPIWLTEVDRVVTRLQLHKGALVDFAYVQQHRNPDGTWLDVATFDCRHDEAHVHWHDQHGKRSGREAFLPIRTQADVEVACDLASDMLCHKWQDNLRRCTDG